MLRWLQWFCPLKYTLEALSVNEVGSGLQIKDVLQGVPVDVSAALIMQLVRLLPFPHSDFLSLVYHSFSGSASTIIIGEFHCAGFSLMSI